MTWAQQGVKGTPTGINVLPGRGKFTLTLGPLQTPSCLLNAQCYLQSSVC